MTDAAAADLVEDKRVLVAGDDGALAEQLRADELLAGVQVDRAGDSGDALQQLRRRPADVVIAGGAASPAESLAFAREVLDSRPGTCLIVLAPSLDQPFVVECLRSGVFACFSAPFDVHDVAVTIASAARPAEPTDIVVLSAVPGWLTLRVSSRMDVAERLLRFMAEYRSDVGDAERQDLIAAFREMLVNAMEHGAGFDPHGTVVVSAARVGRAVVFHVRDFGPGFTPGNLAHAAGRRGTPNAMAHMERRAALGLRPGGFGIMVARDLVDELAYNARGNEVIIIKYVDE